MSIRVKTELMAVGSQLKHAIQDEQGRMLLKAGTTLTAEAKAELQSRGLQWVMLHPSDAANVMGVEDGGDAIPEGSTAPSHTKKKHPSRPIPSLGSIHSRVDALKNTASYSVENRGIPLQDRITPKGSVPYDLEQKKKLTAQFASAKNLLENLVDEALAGTARDSQTLDAVATNYVRGLTEDTDLVIATAAESPSRPVLTERAIRMAIMAMSLAIELGFDEDHVREVGLCGLVCDWGKYYLPEKLQDENTPISAQDRDAYGCHPLYTAELLASIDGISREVRLAATQVHENADGSGFPRGLSHAEIHPYARILNIADIYLSLTTETRGRQSFVPYDVMVYLLHQIKSGRITEQLVRALLNVVSLFPIGSHVRLSDGSEAKVIRRNESHYSTPIVQLVGTDRKLRVDSPESGVLNLAKSNHRVADALPTPDRDEQRIGKDQMNENLWKVI